MYQNGTVTNLGVNFEPAAISSSGEVVGYLNVDGGVNVNAAIYDNGTVTDLDSVDADSAAAGVTQESGDVVGSSQPIANGSVEPIEWLPDGTAINLGQLPGFPDSEATGINDSGTIVGTSSGGPNGAETAFVDTDGTGLTQLGDSDSTTAVAINDAGDVVGEDIYGETPVVWSNGVETDTPLLDGAEDGFATGINSNGAVVGYGDMGPNGQTERRIPLECALSFRPLSSEFPETPVHKVKPVPLISTHMPGQQAFDRFVYWLVHPNFGNHGVHSDPASVSRALVL